MTIVLGIVLYIVIGFATLWVFERLKIEALPGTDDAGYFDDLSKGMLILAWWMPILAWAVTLLAKALIWIYERIFPE